MDTPNLPPKVRGRLEGLGYVLSFTGVVYLLAHSLTDWGLPFWPMYIIIGIFLCGIMVKVFFAFRQGLTKYAVVYGLMDGQTVGHRLTINIKTEPRHLHLCRGCFFMRISGNPYCSMGATRCRAAMKSSTSARVL